MYRTRATRMPHAVAERGCRRNTGVATSVIESTGASYTGGKLPSPPSHRADLSPYLIHFTKGDGSVDAFEILIRILTEKRLLAGNGLVKGGTRCVSFTEAPFEVLSAGFHSPWGGARYSRLGLRFSKTHVFEMGGRPVYYQPDAEFNQLPPDLQWRHVRFEPLGASPVDWTWEREWRLRCEKLPFRAADVEVVLPDEATEERFQKRIQNDSFNRAWEWTNVLGEIGWMMHGPNPWRVLRPKAVN